MTASERAVGLRVGSLFVDSCTLNYLMLLCKLCVNTPTGKETQLPATLKLTAAQLQTLADFDSTAVISEQVGADGLVEAWLIDDPATTATESRSVLVQADGKVAADGLVNDS